MDQNACLCSEAACCGSFAPPKNIPKVTTTLNFKDISGTWKARWGINRYDYKVVPGLYSTGKPDSKSPVLVTANYKLTFDTVRKNLTGIDCWLLILDTKGINVWCAAGKGTFGTKELVNRINETGLSEIIEHRKLVVPQLGATGINSNEVFKRSGFSVIYGPVRAKNIKEFILNGYKATQDMRTVKFTLPDRIAVMPIELVQAAKISIPVFCILFLLNLIAVRRFGIQDFIVYVVSILAGAALTPILLPIIPGRAFAFKGWLMGMLTVFSIIYFFGWFNPPDFLLGIAYMLLLPSHSAYLAMNFTGSSTYTSFSGVIKEMKIAVPLIIISSAAGAVLLLIKTFIG